MKIWNGGFDLKHSDKNSL